MDENCIEVDSYAAERYGDVKGYRGAAGHRRGNGGGRRCGVKQRPGVAVLGMSSLTGLVTVNTRDIG